MFLLFSSSGLIMWSQGSSGMLKSCSCNLFLSFLNFKCCSSAVQTMLLLFSPSSVVMWSQGSSGLFYFIFCYLYAHAMLIRSAFLFGACWHGSCSHEMCGFKWCPKNSHIGLVPAGIGHVMVGHVSVTLLLGGCYGYSRLTSLSPSRTIVFSRLLRVCY